MDLFIPNYIFRSVCSIRAGFLAENGIRALILDVDNTLTGDGSQFLSAEVEQWIASMKSSGIQLCICSNNFARRVRPFAEKVGLPFVSFSLKPSTRGLRVAQKHFALRKDALAVVGDQIFTDTAAARLFGIPMLMVQPIGEDVNRHVRFKRALEQPFVRAYYRKGGKLYE